MAYCIYLRKSRADQEAEARGEGETLQRHRNALCEYAQKNGLLIGEVYEEIVSGDSIAGRPQMKRLLLDVEAGKWEGVLVMEVERLARGDTIDQGMVAQAFRLSRTRIITPGKTYDPENQFDEEYFEFGLFMSRREYRTITRRLQAGRIASVREGKYMGTRAVYGYRRVRLSGQKGWTLEEHPHQAQVVRLIFAWFLGEQGESCGAQEIANRLNALGEKTGLGNRFSAAYVRRILQNPAYVGMVRWNQRVTVLSREKGVLRRTRPRSEQPLLVRGLHPPLIDQQRFDRVQARFACRPQLPKNRERRLGNPLAGLVCCALCHRTMQRKPSARGNFLYCPTPGCPCSGVSLDLAEQAVCLLLSLWPQVFSPPRSAQSAQPLDQLLQARMEALNARRTRLFELLEQGIYDQATFLSRRAQLEEQAAQTQSQLQACPPPAPDVPDFAWTLADAYAAAPDVQQKNALLRAVFHHIDLTKTHRCRRGEDPARFLRLDVYPLLPLPSQEE